MNILNISDELAEAKKNHYSPKGELDSLELFFTIGRDYMQKYNTYPVNIHSKTGQEQIRKIVFAQIEELMEMMNLLKNKSWCQEEYPVDEEHLIEELCDFWAFTIQLLLLLNLDKNKFTKLYLKKLIVNEFRLKSKY
jgi:hypothetical protein